MLKDRGYIISEKKLAQTKQEFSNENIVSRDSLNMMYSKRKAEGDTAVEDGSDKIFVLFPNEEKLSVDTLEKISIMMLQHSVYNAIVVIKGSTPLSRRDLEKLKPCEIELFHQNELLVNITEHELVPKHFVLSENEKHELLKKYRVKDT